MNLNNIFSNKNFKDFLEYGELEKLDLILKPFISENKDLITYEDSFKEAYKILERKYRNEYFYKNELLNFYLKQNSKNKFLSELPVKKSIIDFLVLKEDMEVIEIKTELDSLFRLEKQIEDYFKAFKFVSILTSEKHLEEIESKFKNSKVGIKILNKDNKIIILKNAIENQDFLSKEVIFKILRKTERERILIKLGKELPKTSQFNYFREVYKIFENLDIELIYKSFIDELRLRIKIQDEVVEQIPYELKSLLYFSKFKEKDLYKIIRFVKTVFKKERGIC